MKKQKSVKLGLIKVAFAVLVGFLNGFFGGGGGLILVPVLQKIYKLETKKAHATAIMIMLPLSIVSSIIYITKNRFDVKIISFVTLGVICGGVIGANLLKKFNNCWIRWIFITVLFASGVRMILN